MLEYIKKMARRARGGQGRQTGPEAEPTRLTDCLEESLAAFRQIFRQDSDFVVRPFEIPLGGGTRAALIFFDGLTSSATISASILQPLLIESGRLAARGEAKLASIDDIAGTLLPAGEVEVADTLEAACDACLMGDTVLLVDGFARFIYINAKGFEQRPVSEPQTETVVRGPREGFTENLRVNTALIRRRLKSPKLRMDMLKVGRRTRTPVCIAYLEDIADPGLIREVRRRLKTIDTDAILNSGYIEEYIEDAPFSVFQTINYTEKPDIVAAKLLEGRCALIVDGTPFVLTLPMLFVECFQSPEDYAVRPFTAVFLRMVRLLAFVISLTAPAVYVALTAFHQELIPTTLLFTVAASSEGIPFTSAVETAIMLVTFEILKEAGIRLPKPVGQAVSIVGALVMGQAAIEAGIVGAPVVIVIAFAAVSSFLIPTLSDATSLLRWYLLVLAATMGGFGITMGALTILLHLASLESFGAVYLHPFSPFYPKDLKDSILRAPMWRMDTRPAALSPQDMVRQRAAPPSFGRREDDP